MGYSFFFDENAHAQPSPSIVLINIEHPTDRILFRPGEGELWFSDAGQLATECNFRTICVLSPLPIFSQIIREPIYIEGWCEAETGTLGLEPSNPSSVGRELSAIRYTRCDQSGDDTWYEQVTMYFSSKGDLILYQIIPASGHGNNRVYLPILSGKE